VRDEAKEAHLRMAAERLLAEGAKRGDPGS